MNKIFLIPIFLLLFFVISVYIIIEWLNKRLDKEKEKYDYVILRDKGYTFPDTLKLDIYKPSEEKSKNKCIVICHGGGGVKRDKNSEREVEMAIRLVKNGYTVLIHDYQLGKNSFPNNVYQTINAVQYARQFYHDDVMIMGLSFGATLAALEGLLYWICLPNEFNIYEKKANVSKVFYFYGISSPLDRTYIEGDKSGEFRPGHMSTVVGTKKCVSCKDKDIPHEKDLNYCQEPDRKLHCVAKAWKDITLLTYLSDGFVFPPEYVKPIFVLVHGQEDGVVNKEQTDNLDKALNKKGFNVIIKRVKNGKHGFGFTHNKDGSLLDSDLFSII